MTSRQFIWLAIVTKTEMIPGLLHPLLHPTSSLIEERVRRIVASLKPIPKTPKSWAGKGARKWGWQRCEKATGDQVRLALVGGRTRMVEGWGVGPGCRAWFKLTRILQCLDVLRSGRLLCHHLYEPGPGILIQLEHWGERQGGAAAPLTPISPPRRHPVGAPAHSSLPCSTWRWLMAPCVGSTRRDPLAPGGLLCVPTLRGNRPEPERSRPLATVGPGRDVTTTIEGRQIEALVPGDSRRVPSGVTSLLTGCGIQVFAWRTLSAPTHRTESRRVPDCTPGRELGDGLSGTWCQFR